MSEIDQLLGQLPMDEIASELGVDQQQATEASRTTLQALLHGLEANAQDPAGAASLAQALGEHDGDVLGSGLSGIDTADGAAIVNNIFGDNTDGVIAQLGGMRGSGGQAIIAKLLPILAPIVLSYLATQMRGRGGLGGVLGQVLGSAAGQAGGSGGGGLGDILGQVLGGAAGQGGAQSGSAGGSGGGLGDILGQILGGATGASTSGTSADAGSATQVEQPSGPLIPTDGSPAPDVTQDQSASAGGGANDPSAGQGGLGDILGQILGQATGSASGGAAGSGASSGPSITDILGGLLGGGKR